MPETESPSIGGDTASVGLTMTAPVERRQGWYVLAGLCDRELVGQNEAMHSLAIGQPVPVATECLKAG